MKLVPVYAEEVEAMAEMPPGTVRLSAEKQQLVGVTLGRAEVRALSKTVRAVAKIAVDERSLTHAHTKVDGWLEDVFVNYVGESVQHGQPLFTLYSPELLSAQQEYLIALRAKRELAASPAPEIARSTEALYAASRDRLRLWDVSDEQIRKLEESGQPQRTITFYAEHPGVILERKALPHMRVEKNTDLYMIADLSRVWAIAEVYEHEAALVSTGQQARMTLTALPGRTFAGKVSFVYPQLDPQTRTLKVRMDFDNPGLQLRPEMFANVEFEVSLGRKLVVPESAVLDSGLKQYVFLNRGDGYFEPREVRLGLRAGGFVVIDGGLKAGDQVVTSANFLIDSESKLKAASTPGHPH
jgi:RND family efflux transporter MFP subunit